MTNHELAAAMKAHVQHRGGATMQNTAWTMMLEAADAIEKLEQQIVLLTKKNRMQH